MTAEPNTPNTDEVLEKLQRVDQMIRLAVQYRKILTPYERNFLADIQTRHFPFPTPAQLRVIECMYIKARTYQRRWGEYKNGGTDDI